MNKLSNINEARNFARVPAAPLPRLRHWLRTTLRNLTHLAAARAEARAQAQAALLADRKEAVRTLLIKRMVQADYCAPHIAVAVNHAMRLLDDGHSAHRAMDIALGHTRMLRAAFPTATPATRVLP